MNETRTRKLLAAMAMAAAFLPFQVSTAADAPPPQAAVKDAPSKDAPGKAGGPPADTSSTGLLGSANEIARELKDIDTRLIVIEKSVAGINGSLAPVGAITQPQRVTALLHEAGDMALDRARTLILIAFACAAVLVVLLAVMLRWSLRGKV